MRLRWLVVAGCERGGATCGAVVDGGVDVGHAGGEGSCSVCSSLRYNLRVERVKRFEGWDDDSMR